MFVAKQNQQYITKQNFLCESVTYWIKKAEKRRIINCFKKLKCVDHMHNSLLNANLTNVINIVSKESFAAHSLKPDLVT